jgi:hypothetical protein
LTVKLFDTPAVRTAGFGMAETLKLGGGFNTVIIAD